jgi:Predicted membrane protein
MAVAAVYLLYPAVFNVNLFDFHPEVIAVPAFLAAIVAARLDKILWFLRCNCIDSKLQSRVIFNCSCDGFVAVAF